ncbi:terminase [bacterium]|nr:terminase [bacterium]
MDSDTPDNDFEYARRNYHDLLAKGTDALDEMIEVARATEHPRAFEVFSNMMKHVADINGNLIDLHKKKKDFDKKDELIELPKGQTTNNVFIGSTTDLQRMLKQEEKIIDHE